MKANIQREITAAALSGAKGTEGAKGLILKGLENFRDVRGALRYVGLQPAVEALVKSRTGRGYVRVALKRGVTVRICLRPAQGTRPGEPTSGSQAQLVEMDRAKGSTLTFYRASDAAEELSRRTGTDVEMVARVLLGIERARKRCYELCEEGTRWL